jgi:hypothetical protein
VRSDIRGLERSICCSGSCAKEEPPPGDIETGDVDRPEVLSAFGVIVSLALGVRLEVHHSARTLSRGAALGAKGHVKRSGRMRASA